MTDAPEHYIHTDDDLLHLWRTLMGPWGFDTASLWIIFIHDDGLMSPVLMPFDDLPPRPDGLLDPMRKTLSGILDEQGLASIAFLIARPGSDHITNDDRVWANALIASDDRRLARWPIHLATNGQVRVFAPDDLLSPAA